jgi:hypothetical protein
MKTVLDFLSSNWMMISPIIYEIAARLFPTPKDISIINGIKSLADSVIPNLKKGSDQTHN